MLKTVSAAAIATFLLASGAYAQDTDRAPPPDAKKLSEIVAKVEQRNGFRYIGDIEWDDGAYEVTYYTVDKAKVEIRFDPVTGEPK
ncbi:hypothetical protein ASD64_03575 [Mesorhizobium sp. Root157]|uniref:PepSY domain-containing protein n=1 Tax=Mesorhizobium sp. Root157 TaxID=1736477 RepID=UPI0006F81191|nr:PepSY domain-containing protein [Mesorhizobium sp. Root157]KQZ93985.1 hypothetical protein ASD64_03575 [Mesorhizobium sp. Root157]